MATSLPNEAEMNAILGDSFRSLTKKQKAFLDTLRIPLRKQTLKWEYGDNEPYDAWVFSDFQQRNVGAAYCRGGFGAKGSPWGLVFFDVNWFGMDSGWYASLGELLSDGWVEDAP